MSTDRKPCPECGASVETRDAEISFEYPGAMVFRGFQVRRGPEHERRCKHWRAERP
jgi:hypothetical protein